MASSPVGDPKEARSSLRIYARSKGTETKDAEKRTGLPFVAKVQTSFAPMASVLPVKSHASFFCASIRPWMCRVKALRFRALSNHNLAMTSAAPFSGARGHDARARSISSSSSELMSSLSPGLRVPSPMAMSSA